RLRRCWGRAVGGGPVGARAHPASASGLRPGAARGAHPSSRAAVAVRGGRVPVWGARRGGSTPTVGAFRAKGCAPLPDFRLFLHFTCSRDVHQPTNPVVFRAITPHQVGRAATIAKGGGGVANGFSDRVLGAAGFGLCKA